MASKLEACAECKRNCLLCHSKTRSSVPLVSSFFKIMLTDKFNEVLFLPPKFAPIVSSLIGKEVPLEDSNGMQWKAKLTLMENSVALNQGWGKFAQDHGLEVGDFLSFHYVLGSHVFVQIFDRTCCEKLDFPMKTRAKADKGSTVKQEPKSSAFCKRKVETTHRQFKTSNMKNAKMVKNDALTDKKRVPRSQAVSKEEIFEEPSIFTYKKGKCKINDSVNVQMPIDSGLSNIDQTLRPQTVVVPNSFDWSKNSKEDEPNLVSHVVGKKMKLEASNTVGKKMKLEASNTDTLALTVAGKKPKALLKQDDPILVPPVVNEVKIGKKVKREALNTDTMALTVAGGISCLVGPDRSFLKLPAALPSSSNKRKTMERSRRIVLLKGPKPELRRVEYHETPDLKVLMGGWEAFCKYNTILPGDECTFELENEAADTFRVTVVANV